jgi:hypothetical protein
MTDLERLGLALVGFAVAVVVAGVLLGLSGPGSRRDVDEVSEVLSPAPSLPARDAAGAWEALRRVGNS